MVAIWRAFQAYAYIGNRAASIGVNVLVNNFSAAQSINTFAKYRGNQPYGKLAGFICRV